MPVTWFDSASISSIQTSAPFSVPIMTIPPGTVQLDADGLPTGAFVISMAVWALPGNWSLTTTPGFGFYADYPNYRTALYDDTGILQIKVEPFSAPSTLKAQPFNQIYFPDPITGGNIYAGASFLPAPRVFTVLANTWTILGGSGGGHLAIEADSLASQLGGPDAVERIFGVVAMAYTDAISNFTEDGRIGLTQGLSTLDNIDGRFNGTVDAPLLNIADLFTEQVVELFGEVASANVFDFITGTGTPTFVNAANWVNVAGVNRIDPNTRYDINAFTGNGTNGSGSQIIMDPIPADAYFMNINIFEELSGILDTLPNQMFSWIEIQDSSGAVLWQSFNTFLEPNNPSGVQVGSISQQLSPLPVGYSKLVHKWQWSGTIHGIQIIHRIHADGQLWTDPNCPIYLQAGIGTYTGTLPALGVPYFMNFEDIYLFDNGVFIFQQGSNIAILSGVEEFAFLPLPPTTLAAPQVIG